MKNAFTQRGLSAFYKAALILLIGLVGPATKSEAQFIYCTPTYSTPCSVGNGDYINAFAATSFSGSTINNWWTMCNGNADNYIYYSTMTVDATLGDSVLWFVLNGPESQSYKMWADWNQDGDFSDPGEDFYTSASALMPYDSISGWTVVPTNAALGTTRLRVRSSWNANLSTFDACSSEFYGETEDYNINVVAPAAPCTGTPTAGTASATPNSICVGNAVVLMLSGNTNAPGITVQWESTPQGAGTWTAIPGATNLYWTTFVSTSTEYRAVVTCMGGGLALSDISNGALVTVNPASACQDSVWPGDANYDYIVDNLDPLFIAIGNGQQGTPRANTSISWYGQYAANWPQSFLAGANYKNADCDGNGMIDTNDVLAVNANYSLTHLKNQNYANAAKTTGLPDLYLDLTGISLVPGTTVNVPLKFGTNGSPANNVYGIAAQINIQGFTPASAPSLSWPSGWMGGSNNTLHFSKAISNNTIDWTYARTNQTDASGYGTIGMVSVAIPSNALGQVIFSLDNVTVMDASGTVLTGYNVIDDTSSITTGIGNTVTPVENVAVVPNPSNGKASLEVSLSKASDIEVKLMDVTGRTVWTSRQQLSTGSHSIALPYQELTNGIYMVQLNTGNAQAAQLLKWIKQ